MLEKGSTKLEVVVLWLPGSHLRPSFVTVVMLESLLKYSLR